ncbi:HEAT repeat domain-containing protein [Promethearchaeum syntrophicum]|uniref:HEAT repeat domain-containing protein n=1 Tax=Promethearchaeum syntrophicum TaxID=2594042 RepID=A0A5B9D7S0_9ARCH|nr:HEAT repeat domain-containing protein [Candidatus Prometheoarchaeum syntrophicum]QEE15083.1 putative lyase [Candidatus Prometheoarchaeum syntrophicum]
MTEIQSLLKQLDSEETRLLTIKRLGMVYDPNLVDHLVKYLLDKNGKIREATIFALSALGEVDTIIDPIINCLGDEVKEVQIAAIKTLGEFRSIRGTKPLIKMLNNSDNDVRAATVVALGLIEDKNSLFPLIDALEDKDEEVKINAIMALGQIGDQRAIDPIIECLKGSFPVQQMAILTLGKFGDKKIISPLKKLLSSPNPKIRQYAIMSLGSLKNSKIIEYAIRLLDDEDPSVQRAAASSLMGLHDQQIVTSFIDRLKDSNPEIRQTACKALGNLKDESAVMGLIETLKDIEPEVREQAAHSLGILGDTSATKPLISQLKKDNDPKVRATIALALGKIEGQASHGGLSKKFSVSSAIRPLSKALSDPDLKVRANSAESLAKISISGGSFKKAQSYYEKAAAESLTWDYHQSIYQACAIGCGLIESISKGIYKDYVAEFDLIYENLELSAKMIGNQTFLSYNYWKLLQVFNSIFLSKTKEQFIQYYRDFGLQLLLLAKKLPEESREILNESQDKLNEKFTMIDKRGLPLEQSIAEMEKLKEEVNEIANKILQLEPLELRMEEKTKKSVKAIESLISTVDDIVSDSEPTLNDSPITIRITSKKERNFNLEEVDFGTSISLDHNKPTPIALIQLQKGIKRESYVQEPRDLWEKSVQRYYDYNIYRHSRILQFTKESIQMRAKPKIIGYLDDMIYESKKLVIFPENSVPYSYLDKLQQFADRFNFFIIAGIETMAEKGSYFNRAYLIGPLLERFSFQQKNSQTVLPPSEKSISEWRENIEPTIPPVFKIFNSPFGKFLILIGQDIVENLQYLPFIFREKSLDFAILLNNGYLHDSTLKDIQNLANETKKPIFLVNTGQFGGTGIYLPNQTMDSLLQNEFTEGIASYELEIPEEEDLELL